MTRKPDIKPENIQVTYSRNPNLRDMQVKAEVYSILPYTFWTLLATKMPDLPSYEHFPSYF